MCVSVCRGMRVCCCCYIFSLRQSAVVSRESFCAFLSTCGLLLLLPYFVLLLYILLLLLLLLYSSLLLLLLLLCFSAFFEFATVGCPAIVWPKSMLLVSVISQAHTLTHSHTQIPIRVRGGSRSVRCGWQQPHKAQKTATPK